MGGSAQDNLYGLALDNSGNVYSTGVFGDTVDFDPDTSTFNLIAPTGRDIYIQKFDQTGHLVWAKSIESKGIGYASTNAITTDNIGNLYLTGEFIDTVDFDPGVGTQELIGAGVSTEGKVSDIFIEKLDNNGDFVWVKALSGNYDKYVSDIELDASNNIYISCSFDSILDVDPNTGVENILSKGSRDVFVEKLDNNGSFEWVKTMGGIGTDYAVSLTLNNNDISLGGGFSDTADFNPDTGVFNLIPQGRRDAFTVKLKNRRSIIDGVSKSINTDINLYPNPTKDIINITSLAYINNVQVMDITGKTLLIDHKNRLDISRFEKGIYFLKISTNEGAVTKKIIKE